MTEEVTDTVVDTAPAPAAPVKQAQTETKQFSVPDEYKDKGWASKVKSEADVYKLIDNQSSLIGKKEVIKPTNWEDEASRNEFIKAMRPETADEYKLPEVFGENESKFYKELLHENGISAYQAEKVFEKLATLRTQAFDAEGMTNELKKTWGSEVQAKTQQAMNGLTSFATKEDLAVFDNVPNNILAAVYRTVSNILDKHGVKETDIASANPSNVQKVDPKAQRSELLKNIMAENTKSSPDWTKLEAMKKQLNESYKVG